VSLLRTRQTVEVRRPDRALGHELLELPLCMLDGGGRPHSGAFDSTPVKARLRSVCNVDRDLRRDRLDLLHTDARERGVHTASVAISS
jgi:hypothetical protein